MLAMPGVTFYWVRSRRLPGVHRSTFVEVAQIVIVSGVSTWTVFMLMGYASLWRRDVFVDMPAFLDAPGVYAADHFVLLASNLFWLVAFASAVGAGWAHLVTRKIGGRITERSGWWIMMRDDRPAGTYPYATVRTDTASYMGRVRAYSAELTPPLERELVLVPPLFLVKKEGTQRFPDNVQRMAISGSIIRSITVAYVRKDTPEEET